VAVDLNAWRTVVKQVTGAIADEDLQRRAWFGIGPEESTPDEDICQFFGDAAVAEFLDRTDTGLDQEQREAGRRLLELMRRLSDRAPGHIAPDDLIDDPRWREIRTAAKRFHNLL
jgi:hypothetical protein